MRRRIFLAGTLASPLAVAARALTAQTAPTKLILLGTGGGPRPRIASSASAQVIVSGNAAYVIDCGDGVARQLAFAGVPLATVRHIFITHHHSDHNADLGNLILLAWTTGLTTRVDVWGPPPLAQYIRTFFQLQAADMKTRIKNEQRVPLAPLVHPHELRQAGPVPATGSIVVTAAVVDHEPGLPSFAYRFDAPDRSIVISGDTARSDALVTLARGADVLVHSAYLDRAAIDRLVSRVPSAATLRTSILSYQTSAEDAGRVAQAAGVRTLVLSHLIPPDDPTVTVQMWTAAAQSTFRGTVIVGRDLLEV